MFTEISLHYSRAYRYALALRETAPCRLAASENRSWRRRGLGNHKGCPYGFLRPTSTNPAGNFGVGSGADWATTRVAPTDSFARLSPIPPTIGAISDFSPSLTLESLEPLDLESRRLFADGGSLQNPANGAVRSIGERTNRRIGQTAPTDWTNDRSQRRN